MATILENILGGGRKATATPAATGAAPGGTGTTTQRQAVPQIDWGTGRVDTGRTNAQAPLAPGASGNGETKTTAQTPRRLTYEEMFMLSNPDPTPTPEQLEKERRKQKRDKIFAAIGDGISALSNLYFTTKGAPSMYSGRETASRRVNDRWEKLAADRDAKMKAYIDGLMKARQADDAYNRSEREWERQLGLDKIKQERDKAADARAEAKENRDAEMHDLNKQLRNNQITQAEYEAKKAEVEARYAPQLEESKIGRNRAAAGASNASARASRARARYYDNGGSSGNRYYGEFQGKTYKTQADYEKAVLDAARDAGVDIYDTEVTERNFKGEPRKQRRVKRSIAAIAAEVDEKTNQFNVEDYRRGGGKGSENSAPPLN